MILSAAEAELILVGKVLEAANTFDFSRLNAFGVCYGANEFVDRVDMHWPESEVCFEKFMLVIGSLTFVRNFEVNEILS